MRQAKQAVTFVRSVLLLATAAACSDLPVGPPTPPTPASSESAPAFNASSRTARDVPAVRIDLPPAPRPWDRDPAALETAVSAVGGYAVVAFKEPGSARALATGNRGAVTAGTVRAGVELLERNGVEVLELLDAIGAARVRIPGQAAARLAAHPLVDFVEPRQYAELQAQTIPWGITMVGAPAFWTATGVTGAGAKIEIVDTGHQQNHVDLPAVPTANCAGTYGGCDDGGVWHGTHVLGIVAARNNTDGVVGVAPGITGANTYMYGACDSYSCATDQIAAGINAGIWNAHIINLSLGGTAYDAGMATAVANAWSAGIVIVAAAGNNISNTTFYPAAYTNVVGVSGVNSDKTFAASGTTGCSGYSNYGAHVDISAPFSAYSTIGINTYGTLCGTSMAAPHVTGVAALLKSQNPTWTNQQIVDSLYARAEDRGTVGKDVYFGHGIVRVTSPLPRANITGPTSITTAGTYTWYANASGGNGTYTYNWEYREGTGAWTAVGCGCASYSRTVSAGNPSFELRVTVTSNGLTGSDTHPVTVNIPTSPVPSVYITGPTYIYGGSSNTWTANPSGGNGTYTYQWQYSMSGSTWSNGATTKSYTRTVGLYATSLYLRVTVTSNGASATSATYYVEVEPSGSSCLMALPVCP
jgi:subtilisin family serine protease